MFYETDIIKILKRHLSCLVDVVFNRQSAFLYVPTVILFSPTCSFIRTRETSYRGFTCKKKLVVIQIAPIPLSLKYKIPQIPQLHINIDSEDRIRMKLYNKRDNIDVSIVNFPFINTNMDYISLSWYSRDCGSFRYSLDIELLLTKNLLSLGFLMAQLKSSLRRLYCRHNDMVNRYGISVSQVTTVMFHLWFLVRFMQLQ